MDNVWSGYVIGVKIGQIKVEQIIQRQRGATKQRNIQIFLHDKPSGGDYYSDKPMSQHYNKRNGYAFVSILNKDRKRCVVKICSNTPPTDEQLHKVVDHPSESKANLSHEQFQQLADEFIASYTKKPFLDSYLWLARSLL